jgi:hypothetical protein
MAIGDAQLSHRDKIFVEKKYRNVCSVGATQIDEEIYFFSI